MRINKACANCQHINLKLWENTKMLMCMRPIDTPGGPTRPLNRACFEERKPGEGNCGPQGTCYEDRDNSLNVAEYNRQYRQRHPDE